MKGATLRQAKKILELFEDTSREQVQEILGSGLMADLRNGNIAEVDRNRFREVIGLIPDRAIVTIVTCLGHYTCEYNGWELFSDVACQCGEVTLELFDFLSPGETLVPGNVMIERANAFGANLSQRYAEALLDNPDLIPESWEKHRLVFPGTIWRDQCGNLRIPYLNCNGKSSYIDFFYIDNSFNFTDRLLRRSRRQ